MNPGRLSPRVLEHDLDRWVAAGWVAPEHRAAILADAAAHHGQAARFDSAGVLALLGVLLIGAGAISFVAANWDEMARAVRLGVLLGGMVAAFAGGWWLAGPGRRPGAGQGLILLGVLLFGADIMLIAQTYHIQAHYPDGVLLWAGGALLTAAVVPSHAALWLAFALIGLWTGQELIAFDSTGHPLFLPVWAVAAAIAVVRGWWRCLGFGVLVLAGWYGIAGLQVAELLDASPVAAVAALMILPLALWTGGGTVPHVGRLLRALGVAGVLLGAWGVSLSALEEAGLSGEPGEATAVLVLTALGLAAAAAGAALARWRGGPWRLRLGWAAGVLLLVPLRLLLEEAAGPVVTAWTLTAGFLGAVVALALVGGREGCAFTRRIAYAAFAADILALYFLGAVSLLSLFVFFSVAGIALLVSALRLERRP